MIPELVAERRLGGAALRDLVLRRGERSLELRVGGLLVDHGVLSNLSGLDGSSAGCPVYPKARPGSRPRAGAGPRLRAVDHARRRCWIEVSAQFTRNVISSRISESAI